ncbi:Uroporphyrinogen decarboxylase [Sedimentisphaera cyanobacteriorum]|uniref:Uroporphyrinogen decarboxylase n=1 Tax=Sedimentisphaera cyanobacteriorum TaxID=1940790 RepID=A0A1Q2HRW5_9BACT|nr:uroporphyrinogen decarboxylase family protein [Sedimentisphaera cyanobacteriorum]AQQ10014.1 Uroporphyrinogen decarboxylase [Sedimentisphaera cyanobacteriorum]
MSVAILKKQSKIIESTLKAFQAGRRVKAPLAGFPGCDLAGYSIKVAQQNPAAHYECIRAIYERFNPDVSFMMMDLSAEANALGIPVRFPKNESATVEEHPISSAEDLEALRKIDITEDSRISGYLKAVELISSKLESLCCAYMAGPITLAGLLSGAEKVAMDAVLEPEKFKALAEFSAQVLEDYASALCDAGADAVCILEPTGVIFGPNEFQAYSAEYVKRINQVCRKKGVETIYHICGNSMHLIESMSGAGVSALSLDSPDTGVDLHLAAEKAGEDVVIIGDINPVAVMKDSSAQEVYNATTQLLYKMKDVPNFILSTGCDLPPGTPPENIEAFMKAERDFKG